MDTFKVYCRTRPLSQMELSTNSKKSAHILNPTTISIFPNDGTTKEHIFQLDGVFDENIDNGYIFQDAIVPVIQNVLNGINSTVFAYGITGAGKSYTMFGAQGTAMGVIPLTLAYLIQMCNQQPETKIKMSYLQIYNEQVFDLLQPIQQNLQLSQDPIQNCVIVQDLKQIQIVSEGQAHELIKLGNSRRVIAETKANEVSSRSHAIVILNLQRRVEGQADGKFYTAKLSLVDLAGSERQSVHTETRGIRTFEGSNINRSLLTLGNCINILSQKKRGSGQSTQFIPYRDSKLTRLLKDSLGGNTKTVMIACISPSNLFYEQTLNTLKYACRANKIQKIVHQNIRDPRSSINAEEYKKQIAILKKQNQILKMNLNMSLMVPEIGIGIAEQDMWRKRTKVGELLIKLISAVQSRVKRQFQDNDDGINCEEEEIKLSILEQFQIKPCKTLKNMKKQNQQVQKNCSVPSKYVRKQSSKPSHQRKLTDSVTHHQAHQNNNQIRKTTMGRRISTVTQSSSKKNNPAGKANYSQYKMTLKAEHKLFEQQPENEPPNCIQATKAIANHSLINLEHLRKKIMEDKKQLSNFKKDIQNGMIDQRYIFQKAEKMLHMADTQDMRLSEEERIFLQRVKNGRASVLGRNGDGSTARKKIQSMSRNGIQTKQFVLNMLQLQQNGGEQSRNRHLKSLNRIINLAKVNQSHQVCSGYNNDGYSAIYNNNSHNNSYQNNEYSNGRQTQYMDTLNNSYNILQNININEQYQYSQPDQYQYGQEQCDYQQYGHNKQYEYGRGNQLGQQPYGQYGNGSGYGSGYGYGYGYGQDGQPCEQNGQYIQNPSQQQTQLYNQKYYQHYRIDAQHQDIF